MGQTSTSVLVTVYHPSTSECGPNVTISPLHLASPLTQGNSGQEGHRHRAPPEYTPAAPIHPPLSITKTTGEKVPSRDLQGLKAENHPSYSRLFVQYLNSFISSDFATSSSTTPDSTTPDDDNDQNATIPGNSPVKAKTATTIRLGASPGPRPLARRPATVTREHWLYWSTIPLTSSNSGACPPLIPLATTRAVCRATWPSTHPRCLATMLLRYS